MVSFKKTMSFVLALGLAAFIVQYVAASSMETSKSADGKPIHSSSVFPAKSSAATGTQGYNPIDGSVIVYGVHIPSATVLGYVVIKDSAGWTALAPTVITVEFGTGTALSGQPRGGMEKTHRFDPPIRLQAGLALQFTQCDTKNEVAFCGTVFYDSEP